MKKRIFGMSQNFKFMIAGLVAGTFLLGALPVYAGPIRAVRNALLGARATKAITNDSGDEATAKANENLRRLKQMHEQEQTGDKYLNNR